MSLVKTLGGWEEVCRLAYERAVEVASTTGLKLTLRALFYWLADQKMVIVHSQRAYKALSSRFARWREKHGCLDILVDKSRRVIRRDERDVVELEGYLKETLESEVRYLEYSVWRLPKWWNQPKKVEIWIEKDTVTLIEEVADELSVDAFPSKGFSSVTLLYEATKRFKGYQPVIISITDFDPSGVCIHETYEKKLSEYGLKAQFRRIMVTPEQIYRYNLPSIPEDDPSYKRILRDPRYPRWRKLCQAMGIEPKPVELDAFAGLYPDEFTRIIREAVDQHFDKDIDKQRRQEEEERRKTALKIAQRLKEILEHLE